MCFDLTWPPYNQIRAVREKATKLKHIFFWTKKQLNVAVYCHFTNQKISKQMTRKIFNTNVITMHVLSLYKSENQYSCK